MKTKRRIWIFSALGLAILIVLGQLTGVYGEFAMSILLTIPTGIILYIAMIPARHDS